VTSALRTGRRRWEGPTRGLARPTGDEVPFASAIVVATRPCYTWRMKLVAILVLFLAAGCATAGAPASQTASNQASASPAASAKPRVICEKEAQTGSHISSRRCYVADETDRERIEAQRELSRPRPAEPPPAN